MFKLYFNAHMVCIIKQVRKMVGRGVEDRKEEVRTEADSI